MTRVEQIKNQAIALMAERSFEGVSLRQLAEAVGIRPGSIYTHYASKGQLLQELFCDYQEDLLSAWMEQRRQGGPRQVLLDFVAVYVRFHLARVAESRIVQLDFRSLDARGKRVVGKLKAQYEGELDAILRWGVAADQFHLADVGATRLAILAVLQGVCAARCELRSDEALAICAEAVPRLVGLAPEARS
ncbi:MAG: TetR/AcrR family transcriptional regulator [Pseudomonadaceae bacterium]